MFTVEGMYIPTVQLFESGDPEIINRPDLNTSVTISKSCKIIDGGSKNYWEVTQGQINIDRSNKEQGLIFVTVSEKVTPSYLGNYSIVGFYTIIVYAVGTILRRVSYCHQK